MILYFSATGNSEYVAKYIGEKIGDEVTNLLERIRANDYSPMESDRPWIVVAPTFAWRMPRFVREYIRRTDFLGNSKMYFVLTCGEETGNAAKYVEKFCEGLNIKCMGCAEIVMPNNYIVMFSAPEKEEAIRIIEESTEKIDQVIEYIKDVARLPEKKLNLMDRVKSSIINEGFHSYYINPEKFYVTEACNSCGLCASVCPLKNIRMFNDKPTWRENCTHCMACINNCPQEAIEYGKISLGKTRYTCPK